MMKNLIYDPGGPPKNLSSSSADFFGAISGSITSAIVPSLAFSAFHLADSNVYYGKYQIDYENIGDSGLRFRISLARVGSNSRIASIPLAI
jgi:hypothetical protein